MAVQLDLPLPEITMEDFHRAWTRFELVSTAKAWNAGKQKVILPTLLRGKLVDYYGEYSEETRDNLEQLKLTLMAKAGLAHDSLTASKLFMSRHQGPEEKVADFLAELKQLFREAYPTEELTSAILLQCFLTGLCPKICQQLLLYGKPDTLERVAEVATTIEYALNFETETDDVHKIAAVHKSQPQSLEGTQKLQDSLDQIVKRLESLEMHQQTISRPQRYYGAQRRQRRYRADGRADLKCWMCGELGHMKRQCPLNFNGPAGRVDGWPQQ